jgi:hypothetical protein
MVTGNGMVNIAMTANELLGKEKPIKNEQFFDVEFDYISY